jgi:hypothetical protein
MAHAFPDPVEAIDYHAAVWSMHCRRKPRNGPVCPTVLAAAWERWCGVSAWSEALMDFAEAGGMITDWGGRPRSRSAIGLTFELHLPNGLGFPTTYRLKDIKAATALARTMRREECPA